MMGERGVSVDHSTIYRWVQKYAPEIEKRLRWQWRQPRSASWRVDETYIKVRGQWGYLWRAIDKFGDTIDFYLSPTRNTAARKRFLGKALNGLKDWELPRVINTDKALTHAAALAELEKEGKCPEGTIHRQVKYVEQRGGGRPWQAEATDPPCSWIQDAENRLRHDQGLRGDVRAAQRSGRSVQSIAALHAPIPADCNRAIETANASLTPPEARMREPASVTHLLKHPTRRRAWRSSRQTRG